MSKAKLSSAAPGSGRLHSPLVEPRSASPVAPLASARGARASARRRRDRHSTATAPTGNKELALTLLVRAYCHLCDEMRAAVRPLAANAGLTLEEIDVDADPALEARWGERVPVLLAGDRELCHYRFDRAAFAAYLSGAA